MMTKIWLPGMLVMVMTVAPSTSAEDVGDHGPLDEIWDKIPPEIQDLIAQLSGYACIDRSIPLEETHVDAQYFDGMYGVELQGRGAGVAFRTPSVLWAAAGASESNDNKVVVVLIAGIATCSGFWEDGDLAVRYVPEP